MEWLNRLHGRIAEKRAQQSRYWDEGGLYAADGEARWHIQWSDVRQVHSYKKDCFAFDQVRLLFVKDHTWIEFSEDDPDFTSLCTVISEKLGIPVDWYVNVIATAAFDTTFTTLYDAASISSSTIADQS